MKVIVTGSCGLIGSVITADLVKDGHEVIGFDLSLGHDLSNEQSVQRLFKAHTGSALVNCFGLNDHVNDRRVSTTFLDVPLEEISKVLDVNVTTLFSVCREYIRNNCSGSIINFSSIYGHRSPSPSLYGGGHKSPGYCMSKGAVSILTKYLAVHAPSFRVNSIVPGGILSDQPKRFVSGYTRGLPANRLMDANEITGIVKLLISSESSYITGAEFFIDGGWNASR